MHLMFIGNLVIKPVITAGELAEYVNGRRSAAGI